MCAFSCMFQYSLCHGMDIVTCDIVYWSAAPHNRIANRTGFSVYVVLVLNAIRYSCHYFLDGILFHHDFHHDSWDYHWDFMAINYLLIYTLGFLYISNSGFANTLLPGCFCPWTLSLNIGLNMFPLDSFMSCLHSLLMIFYRGVPGFVTDFPGGVWCRGLTTCPLYVGPLFANLV